MLLLFESVFVQRSCINLRHFSKEESIVIVSTLLSSYRLSSYFSIINERTSTFFFENILFLTWACCWYYLLFPLTSSSWNVECSKININKYTIMLLLFFGNSSWRHLSIIFPYINKYIPYQKTLRSYTSIYVIRWKWQWEISKK